MILADGKHIQGIFIYDSNANYEKGDLVVDDDCLYICTSGEPIQSALRPSNNLEYFAPYPGNKITSLEEYNSYVSSPDGKEDKYVSSSVLHAVLQQGYYGFGDTGMIEAYITEKVIPVNGEEKYVVDTNVYGLKDRLVDNTNLLDLVMRQEEVNNAYITVDRNLPEIVNFLPEIQPGAEVHCCVLRQYTYADRNRMGEMDTERNIYINFRYRVQELMDFQTGTIYYRSTRGTRANGSTNWQYTSEISNWRSLVVSTSLLEKMNKIIAHYNNDLSINSGSNNGAGTTNKFNFRELIGTSFASQSSRILVDSSTTSAGAITVPGLNDFRTDNLILIVNVRVPITDRLFKSFTTTINTKDAATSTGQQIEYYYLDDSTLLKVEYKTNTTTGKGYMEISVTTGDRSSEYVGANINSIYFRDTRNE